MNNWLFSSADIDSIKVGYSRLMWGFWDISSAGDRDTNFARNIRNNWRSFIREYNNIEPFDLVFFQLKQRGQIHGIATVKNRFYDDQTRVWPKEIERNTVLFPWRVQFSGMIFSDTPLTTFNTAIRDYIDGYGLGKLQTHEREAILEAIKEKFGFDFKFE